MILVTDLNIDKMIDDLLNEQFIGFDTETYGLGRLDKPFSLQFATETQEYYINLKKENGIFLWDAQEVLDRLSPVFDKEATWFIHNAKFDMHKIALYGKEIKGTVHCTQAIERILYNQHFMYRLDACLKRRGKAKNDAVEKEIKENKLYTMIKTDAKKTKTKNKHYDKVSFATMFKYACDDAKEVRWLGLEQLKEVAKLPRYEEVYTTETKLTKASFRLERVGIKVDVNYAIGGQEYEKEKYSEAIKEISKLANRPYASGPKWLASVLDEQGTKYDINPKTGNPIFDKGALAKLDSPITKQIIKARTHEKYSTTYYSSFIEKNIDGYIYATVRQDGTDTGRLSYADPNMQNVPKESKIQEGFQVRKSFIPKSDDYCIVPIDFDQQEFRLMLDYAGEMGLIRDIIDNGVDVHQATADMVGIQRDPAKTLNFGLLYGMGEGKLAMALGLPTYQVSVRGKIVTKSREARELIDQYFGRLPKVKRFIQSVIQKAEARKYIMTWTGRRLHFPNRELCYKAPNHLIQGGCGDIAKVAMPRLVDRLDGMLSDCILQVHDEFIFQVHKDELYVIDDLKNIMQNIYTPMNGMYLTCGVDHSWVSWGKQDIINGYPTRI